MSKPVLVLGGSGRTGGHVVRLLREGGREVIAFGRSPVKGYEADEGVRFVRGEVGDPAALAPLLAETDAVVAALASTNKDPVCSTATRAVIEAANGSVRYVTVSGAGVDADGDQKGVPDKLIGAVMRVVVGGMLRDRQEELALLKNSALQWTALRPPRLVDGAATGRIAWTFDRPANSKITRADLGAAVVEAIDRADLHGRAPFVAEAKA